MPCFDGLLFDYTSMAYSKKLFTYGSKKEAREAKSWTGALKEGDPLNGPSKKSFLKKSVWASAPSKSIEKSDIKAKFEDGDDPFDFDGDDHKAVITTQKTKSVSSFYGSPKSEQRKCAPSPKRAVSDAKNVNSDVKNDSKNNITKKDIKNNDTSCKGKKCYPKESGKLPSNSGSETTSKSLTSKSLTLNCQKNDQKKSRSPCKGKKSDLKPSPGKNKTKATNSKTVDQEMKKLNGEILEEVRNLIECKPPDPQPKLTCDSLPVQFIDDNSILVIRQSEPDETSKKKTRNTPVKKSRLKDEKDVKASSEDSSVSEERPAEIPTTPSKTKKQQTSPSPVSDNDVLTKSVPTVTAHVGDDRSYIDRDSNTDSEDDIPLQRLRTPDHRKSKVENVSKDDHSKYPQKQIAVRKRSLFQCYDKSGSDFTDKVDQEAFDGDGSSQLLNTACLNEISDDPDKSAGMELIHYQDIFEPVTKRNRIDPDQPISEDFCFLQESYEDSSQGSQRPTQGSSQTTLRLSQGSSQSSQRSTQGSLQGSSQGSSNEKISKSSTSMKSPFKAKKSSSSLRSTNSDRRFSSLPTNVTLDDEEMDCPETPPPLYRSSIFGFRKSASSHKVRVSREEKELHIIVRNTKNAHECLEYGQTQQFKDDLEYLMDGLKSEHKVSTRCHSALELAAKCTSMDFRMHIKAHGLTESIFTALEDAFSEEQLLLCSCMILFVLAKDKLKLNFGKKTISFMLQVITKKRDNIAPSQLNEKLIKKIKSVFEKPEYKDVDANSVNSTLLAREALLSLTVKRTGEWFKDEIRELGGLDEVADIIYSCGQCIQKQKDIDESCSRMKQCLALLSDTTYRNTANQTYLLTCRNSVVMESCVRTIYFITTNNGAQVPKILAECLMSIQLLLMNLSHENTTACIRVCKQENGLESLMASALNISLYLPEDMAYENTIVSLCLLINLVAHHPENRVLLNKKLLKNYSGIHSSAAAKSQESAGKLVKPIEALMQMFLIHSEACKEADLMQELEKLEQEETELEAKMHYEEDDDALTCGDKFEDTIDDAHSGSKSRDTNGPLNESEKRDIRTTLDKAQRHMEDSHLSAYAGLLIGLLMEEENENQQLVHSLLPDGDFTMLYESIQKILSFMEMTNPLSKNDQECMERILKVISSCNDQLKAEGTIPVT